MGLDASGLLLGDSGADVRLARHADVTIDTSGGSPANPVRTSLWQSNLTAVRGLRYLRAERARGRGGLRVCGLAGMTEYSAADVSAFGRYRLHGHCVKELADSDLDALLEDVNMRPEVEAERARRVKAAAPAPPPPAAPRATSPPVTWKALEQALGPVVEALAKRIAAVENRPVMRYVGTFSGSVTYEPGQFVTHGGSLFHCNTTTTDRPGINGGWTLAVKAGRDGRDRRDDER